MTRTMRRILPSSVLVLVLSLGSLGAGASHPRTGVATGTAVPCTGPLNVPIAHLGVYRGTRLVAARSVPTGRRFRFVLPPGRYTISNEGHPDGSPTFVVRPGRTTHVRVFDYCM